MDEFDSSRDREDDMYDIIREQDDGSQYLNDSGDGMFEEQPTDQMAINKVRRGIYKASDDLITCSN